MNNDIRLNFIVADTILWSSTGDHTHQLRYLQPEEVSIYEENKNSVLFRHEAIAAHLRLWKVSTFQRSLIMLLLTSFW